MRGTEEPHSVTLWLDKAEACLTDFRPTSFRRLKESQRSASFPTVGSGLL